MRNPPPILAWRRWSIIVGVLGSAVALLALALDRTQFLRSYLFAYMVWTGMALGCLAVLLLHHVVSGKWGGVIRRFLEAGARTLPLMALLLVPVMAGMRSLYLWTYPEAVDDPIIQSKAAYLNIPGFIARAVVYFAIWIAMATVLSRWSAKQDESGDIGLVAKMRALSAPGLIVLTVTATFAFIDWVMSLEPHWYSTVYGLMFLVGQSVEAFAFVIALLLILRRGWDLGEHVTEQHIHDLGNLMFASMVLWAYLSFSQFLIIWSGNLPHEISWYLSRLNGGWKYVALTLVFFHFGAPFVLLLMRDVKRRANRLLAVCWLLLAMRVVDTYWLIEPAFTGPALQMHWADLALLAGIGGWWLAYFFTNLNARALAPVRDPRFEGAPKETVVF